jgi:hypothetical protein
LALLARIGSELGRHVGGSVSGLIGLCDGDAPLDFIAKAPARPRTRAASGHVAA